MKMDKHKTVDRTGALAGSVLRGINPNNRGLRLRILYEQARGDGGPVTGGVVLLDAGDNKHATVLEGILHQLTDAATILGVVRRVAPECVSVANKNSLVDESLQVDGAKRPAPGP
jgi:hypothetical protein